MFILTFIVIFLISHFCLRTQVIVNQPKGTPDLLKVLQDLRMHNSSQ